MNPHGQLHWQQGAIP